MLSFMFGWHEPTLNYFDIFSLDPQNQISFKSEKWHADLQTDRQDLNIMYLFYGG
jgi:hypothetical protein